MENYHINVKMAESIQFPISGNIVEFEFIRVNEGEDC